jgi:hypothetical protein
VLTFYDQVLSGWHTLNRSAQDAIWVDPSDSIGAWAYVIPAQDGPSRNFVVVAVTDIESLHFVPELLRFQSHLRVQTTDVFWTAHPEGLRREGFSYRAAAEPAPISPFS